MQYSMFGMVLKPKVIMHSNPGCVIIITYQMQSFRVTVDAQLLALSQTSNDMMYYWNVNGGWRFVLNKRSCIHYLGVGKALLLYVGQKTILNLSLRGPSFNLQTYKVDLILVRLQVACWVCASKGQTLLHLPYGARECKIWQFWASLQLRRRAP